MWNKAVGCEWAWFVCISNSSIWISCLIACCNASKFHSPLPCSCAIFFHILDGSLLLIMVTNRSPYVSTIFPSEVRLLMWPSTVHVS